MTQEDPADVDLTKYTSEEPPLVAPPRQPPAALWALGGVIVLALLGGGYWFVRTRPPKTAPAATASPTRAPSAQSGEQISLPPLDQTDPLVRQLVSRLSLHPVTASWMATDGLLLNFVVVTDRIADDKSPAAEMKWAGQPSPFRTKTVRGTSYIDPASYHRYDRYAEAIAGLDARGTARLYQTLKPRIRDAYRRLGHPEGEFDPVLEDAIVALLQVPAVEGDVALEPKGIGYAFADPRLEGLSGAQKQFLRMGPQNVRSIQNKLREIGVQLGIAESKLSKTHSL